jgi:hypothetical protein
MAYGGSVEYTMPCFVGSTNVYLGLIHLFERGDDLRAIFDSKRDTGPGLETEAAL